jgi:hypothetical protein
MRFYASIAKVDAEQRMVWGYASTEAVDGEGETILRSAIEGALDDYMKFANIREMHQLSAVGVAKEAAIDDKGLYLGAKIVDDDAWQKVIEGVYKGFSIGGKALARDPANRKTITQLRLFEISLVDRPCNPEAVFDCWKAADAAASITGDTPLTTETPADAAAVVAAFIAGEEIPVVKVAPVDGKTVALSEGEVPNVASGASGETTVGAPVDGAAVDPPTGEVPVVTPVASGEAVVETPVDGSRPAAMIPSGDGSPVQVVNPEGEVVDIDAALTKLDEAGEDDPIVKRKFTAAQRRDAAKAGTAMKDGSFPIENKQDLKDSIQALGRAKDRNATIAHIKRRAKALNLEDELPPWLGGPKPDAKKTERHVPGQVWTCGDPAHQHLAKAEAVACLDQRDAIAKAAASAKPAADAVAQLRDVVGAALAAAGKDPTIATVADTTTVRKGLYTLSDLACMVLQLRSMVCNVDYEETSEKDSDSRLPQLMRDALASLVTAFRAMSDEETAELLESVATNTAEPDNAATFLYMAAHSGDLFKAGARHSKADMATIQKCHDMLSDLGAQCAMPEDDTDKVAKVLGDKDAEINELRKVLDQVEPLTKAVTELGTTIADLRKTAETQAAEIAMLKAQPMPAKTATTQHAVEKAFDNGGGPATTDEDMLKRLGEMSEEERTMLLIKAAKTNPVAPRFAGARPDAG